MTQREKVVGDTSVTFVVLVVGDTAANARDSGSRDLGSSPGQQYLWSCALLSQCPSPPQSLHRIRIGRTTRSAWVESHVSEVSKANDSTQADRVVRSNCILSVIRDWRIVRERVQEGRLAVEWSVIRDWRIVRESTGGEAGS